MKKKFIWLSLVSIAVAALLLASCGPTETTPTSPTTPPSPTSPATPTSPTTPTTPTTPTATAAPKYGGTFIDATPIDVTNFDDGMAHVYWAWTLQLTNEELLEGDWGKGPAGTGEASWLYVMPPPAHLRAGELAESFEMADANTAVFQIRKGVRWQNKPPTNGRELVADDIVFSLIRLWTKPTSYHVGAYPWKDNFEELNGGPWIQATGKYTVVVKTKPGKMGSVFPMLTDHSKILPRDAVEKYGDLNDWRNSIGTGPFMLVDYVSGSAMTFKRNPDYWRTDPAGPGKGNQLPYLDSVKRLVIPDASTRLAAIRTARIDYLGGYYGALGWEDAESIIKTNPEIQYKKYTPSSTTNLYWRVDTKPFDDKRVRHALSMAINRKEIADTLYGGTDALLTWPVLGIPEFSDVYIPIDQLPAGAKEVYTYDPNKAKQILAEAGYPNGFKTSILCYKDQVDLLSVVKAYWEKIGVNLELDVKEYAVFSSMGASKTYKQMYMWGANNTIPFRFVETRPGSVLNRSMVDDPKLNQAFTDITAAWPDEAKQRQLMKEILPYVLDQAYELQFPVAPYYSFWQPWVKNYHGEIMMGYADWDTYHGYIWVDQDLKQKMTGKK